MASHSTAFRSTVNKLISIKLYCDLIKLHTPFIRNAVDTVLAQKEKHTEKFQTGLRVKYVFLQPQAVLSEVQFELNSLCACSKMS